MLLTGLDVAYQILVVGISDLFNSSKIHIFMLASAFSLPAAITSVALHFVARKLTSGSFPEPAAKINKYIP